MPILQSIFSYFYIIGFVESETENWRQICRQMSSTFFTSNDKYLKITCEEEKKY